MTTKSSLTTGPFKPSEFAPDIPQDAAETLSKDKTSSNNHNGDSANHNTNNNSNNNNNNSSHVRDEYKRNKIQIENEENRSHARFAQTDYSSFDSEVIDQNVISYYCSFCGNYCIACESQLNTDCAIRNIDESYCLLIKKQIFQYPGLYINNNKEKIKIIKRYFDDNTNNNNNNSNDNSNEKNQMIKLEIQYRLFCRSCDLPIAYYHHSDINKCQRIFIINDALSSDPTIVQQKISQLKHVFDIAKGKIYQK